MTYRDAWQQDAALRAVLLACGYRLSARAASCWLLRLHRVLMLPAGAIGTPWDTGGDEKCFDDATRQTAAVPSSHAVSKCDFFS